MNRHKYMEVNGLFATINTPEALRGDLLYGLPDYDPVRAFNVDRYPGCPDNWMHGSSIATSYFLGLQAGRGMWFDFTANEKHTHHVAVVISVQGVNPVTNEPMTKLNLKKIRDKCPRHEIEFQGNRFCPHEECGYEWPAQNYLATTTGECLWLDGFRGAKGEVAQYIITAEELRGVAAQVIGDDRVYAIGFAFYLSVNPKPEPPAPKIRRTVKSSGYSKGMTKSAGVSWGLLSGMDTSFTTSLSDRGSKSVRTRGLSGPGEMLARGEVERHITASPASAEGGEDVLFMESAGDETSDDCEVETKLEVGGGARIKQKIGVDPEKIGFWQNEPAGLIYVNYVTPKEEQRIRETGQVGEARDGALKGLRIGNP